MIEDYDWNRLDGLGFAEGTKDGLKSACWKGYEAIGMKNKNGRKVPNCVKVDEKHSEGDVATAEMTANYLPEEPGTGPAKNPQMGETGVRMPRMEEIAKSSNRNGHLAMAAAPNYSEFDSDENNGRMIVNQLRVMREKVDIMLGMLDGSENLEPWCATKIANSSQNLASVADYLRFGVET